MVGRWPGLPVLVLAVAGIACTRTRTDHDVAYRYEMAAVRGLVVIDTAQAQYRAAYGRYASTLAELGRPPNGGQVSAAAADLINVDLAAGLKSGYRFHMVAIPQGYAVYAEPEVFHVTGRRTFYTDHTGVIRERHGHERASVNDTEIQ